MADEKENSPQQEVMGSGDMAQFEGWADVKKEVEYLKRLVAYVIGCQAAMEGILQAKGITTHKEINALAIGTMEEQRKLMTEALNKLEEISAPKCKFRILGRWFKEGDILKKLPVEVHVEMPPCVNFSKSREQKISDIKEIVKQLDDMQKECNCHCTLCVKV